jgi:hypothetical protein
MNSINSPTLAPYLIAFASPSPRCRPAVASPSPRPPFRPPSSSSQPPSPLDEDRDGNSDCHRRRGRRYPYRCCCHHRHRSFRHRPGALPLLPRRGPRRRHSHQQQCRRGGRSGGLANPTVWRDGPDGRGVDKDSRRYRVCGGNDNGGGDGGGGVRRATTVGAVAVAGSPAIAATSMPTIDVGALFIWR